MFFFTIRVETHVRMHAQIHTRRLSNKLVCLNTVYHQRSQSASCSSSSSFSVRIVSPLLMSFYVEEIVKKNLAKFQPEFTNFCVFGGEQNYGSRLEIPSIQMLHAVSVCLSKQSTKLSIQPSGNISPPCLHLLGYERCVGSNLMLFFLKFEPPALRSIYLIFLPKFGITIFGIIFMNFCNLGCGW